MCAFWEGWEVFLSERALQLTEQCPPSLRRLKRSLGLVPLIAVRVRGLSFTAGAGCHWERGLFVD